MHSPNPSQSSYQPLLLTSVAGQATKHPLSLSLQIYIWYVHGKRPNPIDPCITSPYSIKHQPNPPHSSLHHFRPCYIPPNTTQFCRTQSLQQISKRFTHSKDLNPPPPTQLYHTPYNSLHLTTYRSSNFISCQIPPHQCGSSVESSQ